MSVPHPDQFNGSRINGKPGEMKKIISIAFVYFKFEN
jgi:hypothetical protein